MRNTRFVKTMVALVITTHLTFGQTMAVFANIDPNTRPTLDSIDKGSVSQTNNLTNVKLESGTKGTTTINWNDFNVGKDHTVNWEFTAHSQTALNKVNNTGGMSQIYGKLTSSCGGSGSCGYEGTGKVILLNPNGVTFFNGSSVDLNSFTVSSFTENGIKNWDKPGGFDPNDLWKIDLVNKNGTAGNIIIEGGADIYASKELIIAAPNVTAYAGSKLRTDNGVNYGGYGYGNVRIFTGDGMNFAYSEWGHVDVGNANITNSNGAGTINIAGSIDSGKIDIRAGNANNTTAYNPNSNIIIGPGAKLKATKMTLGEDGAIYLEAAGNITVNGADIRTENKTPADASRPYGVSVIEAIAKGDLSVNNSYLSTAPSTASTAGTSHINLQSLTGNARVSGNSTLIASNDVWLYSAKEASITDSNLTANNIYMNADKVAVGGKYETANTKNTVSNSTLTANGDIHIKSNAADNVIANSTLTANDINIKANSGNALTDAKIYSPVASITTTNNNNTLTNTKVKARDGVSAANSVTIASTNGGNTIQSKSDVLANNLSVTGFGDNTISDSKLKGVNVTVKSNNANNIVTAGSTIEATGPSFTLDASTNGSNTVDGGSSIIAPIVKLLAKFNNTVNNGTIAANSEATINAATGNNSITNNSNITASTGKVDITAANGSNTVNNSNVNATTKTTMVAKSNSTNTSNFKNNQFEMRATAGDNTLTATNINNGAGVAAAQADIIASNDVILNGGSVRATAANITAQRHITSVTNATDFTGSKLTMLADQAGTNVGNIDVKLTGVGDKTKGVRAEGWNVKLDVGPAGDLSVHKLWSKNDMTIVANRILAGDVYTGDIAKDGIARAYIRVDGWNFDTSDAYFYDKDKSYELMQNQTPPIGKYPDGTTDFNNRHYLTFGQAGGDPQDVFLVHRLPYECQPGPTPDPPSPPSPPTPPATDVIRLPKKYEPTSNLAPIADSRAGIDVVASAAKIQVADDDEEEDETSK